MRTKTLLLSAAVGAAGLLAANAQVYSVNSVGYVNITVPTGFSMLANPLDTANNDLAAVLASVPDGTTVYYYDTTVGGFLSKTYDELDGNWLPTSPAFPFAPGNGVFIRNTTASPFTLTFVGEVKQGSLSTALPSGFSIVGSQVPQQGTLSALAFPAVDGATVYRYVNDGNGGGAYVSSTYDELDGNWLPTEPTVNVGEAFWARMPSAASWARNFSVNN
jgi:hypothetical protein